MEFFLGTHMTGWLADPRFAEVPLFVSRRTLSERVALPRAVGRWAFDSSGFTELQIHARWTFSAEQYVADVRRFRDAIGGMVWAAPQDWMCEPAVIAGLVVKRHAKPCKVCLAEGRRIGGKVAATQTVALDADERPMFACPACGTTTTGKAPQIHVGTWRAWAAGAGKVMAPALDSSTKLGMDAVVVFHGTGLDVDEHQRRTVANFLELRRIAPDLPIIPVLQGWGVIDYWRCQDLYAAAGVDLRKEPRVGVGTVCRRQGTTTAARIMTTLASGGLKLHGFGFKMQGLQAAHRTMASADSLAWSYAARRDPPMPGHDQPGPGRRTGHINCANCAEYALEWRARLLASLEPDRGPSAARSTNQLGLWAAEATA